MTDHTPLPVLGYSPQSEDRVALVNANKQNEERLLRIIDAVRHAGSTDPRWLAIAVTHFEQGFMALNRAVFQPERIKLPEDDKPA